MMLILLIVAQATATCLSYTDRAYGFSTTTDEEEFFTDYYKVPSRGVANVELTLCTSPTGVLTGL